MGSVTEDITGYIHFLRSCGYSVSLSSLDDVFSPCFADLCPYRIHLHPVCSYLKSCGKTAGLCVRNKEMLERIRPDKACYTCCYAGVEEYVIPLKYEGNPAAVVHISGYRGRLKAGRRRQKILGKKCGPEFHRLYLQLSEEVPSPEQVLRAVKPLEYMMGILYEACARKQRALTTEEQIYHAALAFIYDHYQEPITCGSIAKQLHFSESYVRHVFSRSGKKPIGAFLREVRLNQAKNLLENTDFEIFRIAFECGFSDSNYFSTAFRARFGYPPSRRKPGG